jgi:hypothetical protein
MLGGMGGGLNRTVVTVIDSGLKSRWTEQILDSQMFTGDTEDAHYVPPAKVLYKLLLSAMAGAGSETRAMIGPPRRPSVVNVTHRLRVPFPELKKLLQRIDVDCVLDSEESLRFACAANRTDFETGGAPQEGVSEQTLVGQLVGIIGLVTRKDLNGRVGRVICWHQDRDRWEVKLEHFVQGEDTSKLAVCPTNLYLCPPHFHSVDEYLKYRAMVREDDDDLGYNQSSVFSAALEKLRASPTSGDDSICVICQQGTNTVQNQSILDLGDGPQSTCLPCGHTFHLSCIVPWIREKAECPCCRLKF